MSTIIQNIDLMQLFAACEVPLLSSWALIDIKSQTLAAGQQGDGLSSTYDKMQASFAKDGLDLDFIMGLRYLDQHDLCATESLNLNQICLLFRSVISFYRQLCHCFSFFWLQFQLNHNVRAGNSVFLAA